MDASHGVEPGTSSTTHERHSTPGVIEDGVLAGILGAVVVAVWFLILDTAQGRIFFTPSLLGSVLSQGQDPDQVTSINTLIVFAYTGLHGVVFLIAGIWIAWMFMQFEKNPQFGTILLLLFVLFEAVLFSFEAALFPQLVGNMGSVTVASANIFAAVAMFWFLLRRHPNAMLRLRDAWREE
ncbi:MAG: hypothetical protein GTO40_11720 [Deltaproteobacteria bacterium]|nr:hypothetical protein [Deltaproteobacteria bacterium]